MASKKAKSAKPKVKKAALPPDAIPRVPTGRKEYSFRPKDSGGGYRVMRNFGGYDAG